MTEERGSLDYILDEKRISPAVTEGMRHAQLTRFVRNRARVLRAIYALLKPISFNRNKLGDRMAAVDAFIAKSAFAIAQGTRNGFVISLSVSFGLGLSDKLIARLKSERLKSWIPKSGGFYYVAALGCGVFIRQTGPKRRRLVFDLFADFDRLSKIHTYAAEGSIAVNWGIAMDRSYRGSVEKMDSHYVGILGVVRQSTEHFSYSLITGLALPPYLPVGMVYSNETNRARIQLISLPWFSARMK